MSRPDELLKNVFYGYEISDPTIAMRWVRWMFHDKLSDFQFSRIYEYVRNYFYKSYEGVFGGQITAGDAIFLAAMIEWQKPTRMLEIGVASGFSSAFILYYASSAGYCLDSYPYLYSFDIVEKTFDGNITGDFLRRHYPEYIEKWALHVGKTSIDLIRDPKRFFQHKTEDRVLAFVDGGHNNPWPLMDLSCLRLVLPRNSWAVLQDTQMMERWIADCIIFDVPSPAPIRGVNLAFTLWPGEKIVGHDLCYNSSSVSLDISDTEFVKCAMQILSYPFEIQFNDKDLILRALREEVPIDLV